MSSTPQDPSGSNQPQWNNPGESSGGSYPGQSSGGSYPGQSYPGQQSSSGQYPAYSGGQQQYGQGGYDQGGYGQQGGTMKRPGTVTAAAWITIIMSVLTGGFWILLGLAMLLAGDSIVDELQDSPEFMTEMDRANISSTQLEDGVTAFGVGFIVVGLLMLLVILAARGVLKGSNAARIVLVVLSVLTLLVGIVFLSAGIGVIWIIAAIAVIVLLYVGNASRWFSQTH